MELCQIIVEEYVSANQPNLIFVLKALMFECGYGRCESNLLRGDQCWQGWKEFSNDITNLVSC